MDNQTDKKEKLTRKERRRRWKEAKRAKRAELKEYYRYAPWGKRVWNLYLKKIVNVLLMLTILVGLVAVNMGLIMDGVVAPILMDMYDNAAKKPLTPEQEKELYEMSPIDEEGAARIDALPRVGEDETWTVCVYMIGADLEDMGENDLSDLLRYETRAVREEIEADKAAARRDSLDRFRGELEENGLGLPAFFYYPVVPVASSTTVTEDVIVAERDGFASNDIAEMTADVWSDNINVVIQTGGARRWSNQLVNPNRTQRFTYHNGEFKEVANLPLERASSRESLEGFLRFCKEEYPSDHRILVLWNHGGGPFGYGHDAVYGGSLSLKDIREALSSVYRPSKTNPAFDIIGYDACLMSTLEATHALDGFADYYCVSEEVEPGDGWDYDPWLKAMSEDPTMSPAQIARSIADSYTDHYMHKNVAFPIANMDVTFSVLDAQKAEELYQAYCDLAEVQLRDAAGDIGVLAELSRAANKATHYGSSSADVYNMIDLGNYMDLLSERYPEESARVRKLIGDAVLYHRENGALSDSTGIAVYFPTQVDGLYGLMYYLDYVYNISEDDAVTALYYYKQAGCLTDELRDYVATITDKEPRTLDITPFIRFTREEPSFDADGALFPVTDALQDLIVNYELEVNRIDEKKGKLVYYGREEAVYLDGEGHLASDFDGRWVHMGGVPLYVEVVSSAPSAVEYRAHVEHNGEEAYLLISRDRDTDALTITGLHKVTEEDGSKIVSRTVDELEPGAKIKPIYTVTDLTTGSTSTETGKKITFTRLTDVELKPLPEGQYLSTAVITDQRGDSYYSAVVASTLDNGAMKDWHTDTRFIGRSY